ncbi:MAG: PatB family C-S lyase [Candidatus Cloacimonadota bacterium]|nr:PatB family C-S lyase [Candidatus Cloacimonadota bacterium]
MKYDFERKINRKGTDSIKWDYFGDFIPPKDCLPMWVADMDFAAPPEVTQALLDRAKHPVYGYTMCKDEFYQPIIKWISRRLNWEIEQEWMLPAHDIVSTINIIIQNFSNENDKVLIQTPVYPPFAEGVVSNNRKLVDSKLVLKDKKYFIDFQDLERKLSGGIKIMILCSPHNPIGRVWNMEELERIGNLCVKYDVLLISDEIHADLIFSENKHTCIASISDEISDNTITLYSGAKTFNIAGLKIATVIISNKKNREKFQNVIRSMGLWGGNIFGYEAMKVAYSMGEEWLEQLILVLEENKKTVVDFFAKYIPKVSVIDSEGTFLLWLDFRKLFNNQEELNDFIFYKARIGFLPGNRFGENGRGFMRMNIGCPKSTILEALKKMKKALE